ncbi:MAG: SDR family oxidoreductase, partial [Myxococcales bacterium]|nr:SDR family oxidoreductase [Myxococcales bacterium]
MSSADETLFITGATGFLGGYAATRLLDTHPGVRLRPLVRARSREQAIERLWGSFQLHVDAARFWEMMDRVEPALGDLHAPDLGLDAATREAILGDTGSVLHIAASLNRKSDKACLNTNVRGTLSVVKLARALADGRGLRRYTHVSTVAVAGKRNAEVVLEDDAIDWDRSDYDPYARTKKLCEHLAHELLPDVQKTILRPSIVMGDSRFPETAQFDMVRATAFLADLPVVPFRPTWRADIVNADWVGRAIETLHMKARPEHTIYHLSAGLSSPTLGAVGDALHAGTGKRIRFAPSLLGPFQTAVDLANGWRAKNTVTLVASLLKVFL